MSRPPNKQLFCPCPSGPTAAPPSPHSSSDRLHLLPPPSFNSSQTPAHVSNSSSPHPPQKKSIQQCTSMHPCSCSPRSAPQKNETTKFGRKNLGRGVEKVFVPDASAQSSKCNMTCSFIVCLATIATIGLMTMQ